MREAEALATLRDPVRVESSLLLIEPRPHGEGWSFASGLIENEHGAMVQTFTNTQYGGTLAGQ